MLKQIPGHTLARIAICAAMLALIVGAAPAHAQPVRIPNSEMPGRERQRFIALPAPKSQVGDVLTLPRSNAHATPKRRHWSTAKPKLY
jgi:hypothetical protein